MNIHVTIDFLQFNNLFVSLQSELQNEHLDKYKYQKKERKLFLILTLSTIEESSSLDSPRIVESDNTDDISSSLLFIESTEEAPLFNKFLAFD